MDGEVKELAMFVDVCVILPGMEVYKSPVRVRGECAEEGRREGVEIKYVHLALKPRHHLFLKQEIPIGAKGIHQARGRG